MFHDFFPLIGRYARPKSTPTQCKLSGHQLIPMKAIAASKAAATPVIPKNNMQATRQLFET
jgi:hypothetical protein